LTKGNPNLAARQPLAVKTEHWTRWTSCGFIFLGSSNPSDYFFTLRKIPRLVKQKSEIFLRKFRKGLFYFWLQSQPRINFILILLAILLAHVEKFVISQTPLLVIAGAAAANFVGRRIVPAARQWNAMVNRPIFKQCDFFTVVAKAFLQLVSLCALLADQPGPLLVKGVQHLTAQSKKALGSKNCPHSCRQTILSHS
jgi:hypothetical protein